MSFTLLKFGKVAPSGGLSKLTGSSSSLDWCDGRRVGLKGLLGVVGVRVGGCSFPSGLLAEGSKAVGDRARLACKMQEAEQLNLKTNLC